MFENVKVGAAAAWEATVEEDLLLDAELGSELLDVMDELRPHKTEKSRAYAKVRRYFDKAAARRYAETH